MRGGNPLENFTAYSVIIYLNDDFVGGCTTFFEDDERIVRTKSGLKKGCILDDDILRTEVNPEEGSVLVFPHGRHQGCFSDPLHEGEDLRGSKRRAGNAIISYVIRPCL